MMSKNRQYDNDFKIQAVKLAKEIGTEKAALSLFLPFLVANLGYNALFSKYQADSFKIFQ